MSAVGDIVFISRAGERVFSNPALILTATRLAEVQSCLQQVAEKVSKGYYAAGFLTYEAAPAFDAALCAHPPGDLPLVWFGLYREPPKLRPLPLSDKSLAGSGTAVRIMNGPPAALRGRSRRLGRKGESFLPNLSPPRHKVAGADAIMRIAGPDKAPFRVGPWKPLVSAETYHQHIRRILDLIVAGDTYQINYTFPLESDFRGDTLGWFRQLCAAQQADHCAFIQTGRYHLLSASPEFFKKDGDILTTRPMKGTARRGRWPAEDGEAARALAASAKERAENVMIVDVLRNDMSRVSRPGSVNVARLWELERYPTVWQMTSTIFAQSEASVPEILAALFPSGSVTGAPKIRATEIIRALEPYPRGIYCGTIGWWAPDGQAEFNVAIRTVTVDTETGTARYHVGGGITHGSAPEKEYAECLDKAEVLSQPMPVFDLLESLRWEGGYFLLREHLDRLAESAAYFDFAFDRQAVETALNQYILPAATGLGPAPGVMCGNPNLCSRAGDGADSSGGHGVTAAATLNNRGPKPPNLMLRNCKKVGFSLRLNRLGRAAQPEAEPYRSEADKNRPASGPNLKIRLLLHRDGSCRVEGEPLKPSAPIKVGLAGASVDADQVWLYHKTTCREIYRQALRSRPDCEDVILWNQRNELTESTIANVVLELDGRLWTPPVACGLLAGTFRRHLLETGVIQERVLHRDDLRRAQSIRLINSVRRWMEVQWMDRIEANTEHPTSNIECRME